jgi:hypothetical protein
MDQYTRGIVGFGVHAGTVDGVALGRMFNHALRWHRWLPRYLSSDNDPLYRFHQWQANLRILEVTEIKTVPYVPLSHPFVERLTGTIRRECLDHTLFWTSADLEKTARFQDLLQPPPHPSITGRANAGHAPVTTHRQSVLVSLATSLSRPISDTGSCLIFRESRFLRYTGQPFNLGKDSKCKSFVFEFLIAAHFANLAVPLPPYQFASHTNSPHERGREFAESSLRLRPEFWVYRPRTTKTICPVHDPQ